MRAILLACTRSGTVTQVSETPQPAAGRVQLNARISPELDAQMRTYQQDTGITRQTLLEQAIGEFLTRHGGTSAHER